MLTAHGTRDMKGSDELSPTAAAVAADETEGLASVDLSALLPTAGDRDVMLMTKLGW